MSQSWDSSFVLFFIKVCSDYLFFAVCDVKITSSNSNHELLASFAKIKWMLFLVEIKASEALTEKEKLELCSPANVLSSPKFYLLERRITGMGLQK